MRFLWPPTLHVDFCLNLAWIFADTLKVKTAFFMRPVSALGALLCLCAAATAPCQTTDASPYYRIANPDIPLLSAQAEPFVRAADTERTVPELLSGVWHNKSRYVVFDTGAAGKVAEDSEIMGQVLRLFYRWYADRAAESPSFSNDAARDVNNATSASSAESVEIHWTPLTYEVFSSGSDRAVTLYNGDTLSADGIASGAWDMEVHYPGRNETYHIPVAVIGNRLYLHFVVKQLESIGIERPNYNLLGGYWRDYGSASGVLVSPPANAPELRSFYIAGSSVYQIRYWRTDLDYDESARAVFSDGDDTYDVPKMLLAQGLVYTCVNGRGSRIRNITRSPSLPEDFMLNSVLVTRHGTDEGGEATTWTEKAATICALGEPYLTLLDSTETLESIAARINAQKKPFPPPLFPPHGILDFDWSIIEDPPENWNKRMHSLGK